MISAVGYVRDIVFDEDGSTKKLLIELGGDRANFEATVDVPSFERVEIGDKVKMFIGDPKERLRW